MEVYLPLNLKQSNFAAHFDYQQTKFYIMNVYQKYCPNVFIAKCDEQHEKGDTILLETKYGKEHECIVFNFLGSKDGFFFYSIVRADGYNAQEHAKQKAARLQSYANTAEQKSSNLWQASNEGREFLSLGQPILIGHHSEKRHRALIDRNHDRMSKAVEETKKAENYISRSEYWEAKANTINLSMPESIEYYEYKLEKAKERHEGLKNGTIKRDHSFSLPYANKDVKEAEKNLSLAKKLWA